LSDASQRPDAQAVQPADPADRVQAIDILRGIALFGVMAVNIVNGFRVSMFQQFLASSEAASLPERLTGAFITAALELKALALFSLLFGVSLAILFERLSASGRPLYWLSRRLAALLVFGLVHLLLIWNGDILTEYAIAGFLVLPLLLARNAVVAAFAAAALALYVALLSLPLPPPLQWPGTAALEAHTAEAMRVFSTGGFADVRRFSLAEMPFVILLHVLIFPRTFALFLLGILAWRTGLFRGGAQQQRRLLPIALAGCAIGGALSVADYSGVPLVVDRLGVFRNALPSLAPVILALGYGAAIVAFVQSRGGTTSLRWFAPIGRMAFTNYILQSVIFGAIFYGYGLGYFGRLGAFETLVLGTAVFAAQCWLSALWLHYYRFGPLEWLWRRLMYGRPQAMRYRRT